jgi:hypothetical protein
MGEEPVVAPEAGEAAMPEPPTTDEAVPVSAEKKAPASSLEESLMAISLGAESVQEGTKDTNKDIIRMRRRSKEVEESLSDMKQEITDAAEASSVWRNLGGFNRNRRNSKEYSDDDMKAAFDAIDTDGSGTLDREELAAAIRKEGGKLSDEQVNNLINFADADGDGEIDFEEYKKIMTLQSGVPKKASPDE